MPFLSDGFNTTLWVTRDQNKYTNNNNNKWINTVSESVKWQRKSAYLSDIHQHVSNLYPGVLQGEKESILASTHKLLAFTNKLSVWKKQLSRTRRNVSTPPSISTQTKHENVIPLITQVIWDHGRKSWQVFPSLPVDVHECVRNPSLCLSWENCACVCQKFCQEFHKRANCHAKGAPQHYGLLGANSSDVRVYHTWIISLKNAC